MTEGSEPLVVEFVEWWIRERDGIKDATRSYYLRLARLYLAPTLAAVPLRDITEAHAGKMVDTLKARGLVPSTVTNVFSLLASAMVEARERGLLTATAPRAWYFGASDPVVLRVVRGQGVNHRRRYATTRV
jgi:hypothetical protein